MQRFTLNGFAHSVRIEGPANGSPILLLHGFPDDHTLFDKQVGDLRGASLVGNARLDTVGCVA